jgi:hypothetical protein
VAAAVAFGWVLHGFDGGVDDLVCHGDAPLDLSPKVFKRNGLSPNFDLDLG